MIQELREYSQSFFFKLLLGIICITFVISFGIGSFGDRKEVIAKVNGREILLKDYRKAYQNRLQSLRQQFGENADAFAEQFNLRQGVFDQIVNQELMAIVAASMNLTTTDLELQEQIRSQPYFQKNGSFDFQTYSTVLSQNRTLRKEYEDSLRRELMVAKLQSLLGNGLLVSSAEVDEIFKLENEKLEISYIYFNPDVFLKEDALTEIEVRRYYDENREYFKSEKAFRIDSLVLGLEHFKNNVRVREREIRRYYEKNLGTYTTPAKVKARHILLKVEPNSNEKEKQKRRDELEKLLAKIQEGDDFEELAKQHSEDATAQKGGDLGWFQPGEMVPAFEEAAFRLEIGEVSGIVQSPFGFHLIRVDKRNEEIEKALEEVREEINAILAENRAGKRLEEELSRLVLELPEKSLGEHAADFGLSVSNSELFSQNGVIPSIGSVDGLVPQLENKKVEETGIWTRNPVQGHVIYQLKEIQEPAIQDFEEVKTKVKDALKRSKAWELARESARIALGHAENGTSMADIAEQYNLKVQNFDFTATTQYLPQLGENETFRKAALSLKESKSFAISESEERTDLIQLLGRHLNDVDIVSTKEQIRIKLLQRLQQLVLANELERLRKSAEVEIINPAFQPPQKAS